MSAKCVDVFKCLSFNREVSFIVTVISLEFPRSLFVSLLSQDAFKVISPLSRNLVLF